MKKIPISVTVVHVLLVIGAVYIQPSPIKMAPRRPVTVKTVVLAKEQYKKAVAQIQETPLPPLPVAEPEPESALEAEEEPIAAEQPYHLPPNATPKEPPTLLPRPTPKAESTPRPEPTPKPGATPKFPGDLKLAKVEKKVEKPKEKSTAKPAAKKPVAKKTTPAPVKKEVKTKSAPTNANRDLLISMMQKNLNTLETTSSTSSSGTGSTKGAAKGSANASPTIGTLASESLSFEVKYEEELVSHLQSLLSFPEKGDVKIKLTLNRNGEIQRVEIIKASSSKNRMYIENTLPSCPCPSFESRFKGETTHIFTLNLTSENSR